MHHHHCCCCCRFTWTECRYHTPKQTGKFSAEIEFPAKINRVGSISYSKLLLRLLWRYKKFCAKKMQHKNHCIRCNTLKRSVVQRKSSKYFVKRWKNRHARILWEDGSPAKLPNWVGWPTLWSLASSAPLALLDLTHQQSKQHQHNAAATESKNLCCYNHHLCTKISLSNLQERK